MSSNTIRLKRYKTMLSDGRSSVTADSLHKDEVLVFLLVGTEPLTIADANEYVDAEKMILLMAEYIRKQRKVWTKQDVHHRSLVNAAVNWAYKQANLVKPKKKKLGKRKTVKK